MGKEEVIMEVKIERVDNGYIVCAPFPYGSYTNGKNIFYSLSEVLEFIKKVYDAYENEK